MSDYETFQKWASEADEIIERHSINYLFGWCFDDPSKQAFMRAVACRRQLKTELDRLEADGLAYQAMIAMNSLDKAEYGYISPDNYDDDYPYISPDNYDDDYPCPGPASVWRCETQTAESAPECTVSLGTEEDLRAWEVGDAITLKIEPDSGVVHQMAQTVGAMSDFQERYERAVMDAMRCGAGSFKGPSGAQITAEDLTWPRSPSYYTPEQEETIALGYRNLPKAHELHDSIALTIAEQLRGQQADMMATDDHQSPLDAIGEDVLNTVIAPGRQGQTTAKPQAHTDPYFSEDEQRSMEPVEVWCKPKVGKAYRHCVRPRKAAEELVERNNSQYRGIAEYWIEP